ncbi:MAG: winged helix-turn-helix domain-containing protein [Anaerolineae bacterium]|nr:winged helix-turn-helix domain-containing protein [Anaerolineae bacterium]
MPSPDSSAISSFWREFPFSYRAEEMRVVAEWLAAGESGTVIGLPGAGRATLLGFLCHRPDVLQVLLSPYERQIILVPVDLINLPDNQLATLYRTILRSFFEVRYRFNRSTQWFISDLYRKSETARDPFLPQSALREMLLLVQSQEIRIGLVIDRFDRFCQSATPRMTNTLRGLRDSFKETLCYIVSLPQELTYLTHLESLSPLQGILDTHVCWVGPLTEADVRHMVIRRTRHLGEPLSEQATERLIRVTGAYPSLIRVACNWWGKLGQTAVTDWEEALLQKQSVQHRLSEIWNSLTLEEQQVLSDVQKRQLRLLMEDTTGSSHRKKASVQPKPLDGEILAHLAIKGACRQDRDAGWRINGSLLDAYVAQVAGRSKGKIWADIESGEVYQGTERVENLQPMERSVLQFLIQHPRVRHSHTDLIEAAWPDDVLKEGVSTEALYQTIRGIRKKIEPDTAEPRYIINWRGQRQGGYQFFPEGRPVG